MKKIFARLTGNCPHSIVIGRPARRERRGLLEGASPSKKGWYMGISSDARALFRVSCLDTREVCRLNTRNVAALRPVRSSMFPLRKIFLFPDGRV